MAELYPMLNCIEEKVVECSLIFFPHFPFPSWYHWWARSGRSLYETTENDFFFGTHFCIFFSSGFSRQTRLGVAFSPSSSRACLYPPFSYIYTLRCMLLLREVPITWPTPSFRQRSSVKHIILFRVMYISSKARARMGEADCRNRPAFAFQKIDLFRFFIYAYIVTRSSSMYERLAKRACISNYDGRNKKNP